MNKFKIFLKNFTAGRKTLFKRIGIFLGSALAVFEIINIFLEDGTVADICSQTSIMGVSVKSILTNVLIYLAAGIILALITQGAFAHYSMNITGTDIKIEIAMGDIMTCKGEIVVPCNTAFAGRDDIIGSRSIQSQMTSRIKQSKGSSLTNDEYFEQKVSEALNSTECEKRRLAEVKNLCGRDYNLYEYGTMASISLPIDGRERSVILLAVAEMTAPHKPKVDGKHLMQSIDTMWDQIASSRIREQTLVVPILGTGSAGITDKPEQTVARYIMRTFADNAPRLGIHKLILSVYPQDYLDNKINLEELRCYADYLCRFPDSDFDIK